METLTQTHYQSAKYFTVGAQMPISPTAEEILMTCVTPKHSYHHACTSSCNSEQFCFENHGCYTGMQGLTIPGILERTLKDEATGRAVQEATFMELVKGVGAAAAGTPDSTC
jgi:hypothetical protein